MKNFIKKIKNILKRKNRNSIDDLAAASMILETTLDSAKNALKSSSS